MSTRKSKAGNKPAQQSQPQEAGFCVYIGPTILGVIQNGTVYRGAKEDALASAASAVRKYPLVASLIVCGDTLAADRIKVNTPGNLLYVNYRRLASGRN